MTTTLRFHAGVDASGGTIIELRHGDHRLVFDFGFVFDPPRHVFDGVIRPGRKTYLADLLKLELLPRVDGVFSARSIESSGAEGVVPAGGCSSMVLISHPHEDHVGAVGLVDPEVPVVMSEDAARLLRALSDLGQFDLPREVTGVRIGEAFSFGPFEITPRYSDHPAWGSVGYEIASPDGRLFWTGDWRLHGRGRERAAAELELVRQAGVDLLITEGTSLGSALAVDPDPALVPAGALRMGDGLRTEEGVDAELAAVIEGDGPVFVNVYNRDFSPLQNLRALAAAHGRDMAVQPDVAVILERITGELLAIYIGRSAPADLIADATPAVRDVLERARLVGADEVAGDPGAWVVQLDYASTPELLAFTGAGGTYLHVGGIPLGGETPERQRLMRVLEATGTAYSQAERHTHFAHATPGHVALLTELVEPRYVAIVHAPYPESFQPPVGERIDARGGAEFLWVRGQLRRAGDSPARG